MRKEQKHVKHSFLLLDEAIKLVSKYFPCGGSIHYCTDILVTYLTAHKDNRYRIQQHVECVPKICF